MKKELLSAVLYGLIYGVLFAGLNKLSVYYPVWISLGLIAVYIIIVFILLLIHSYNEGNPNSALKEENLDSLFLLQSLTLGLIVVIISLVGNALWGTPETLLGQTLRIGTLAPVLVWPVTVIWYIVFIDLVVLNLGFIYCLFRHIFAGKEMEWKSISLPVTLGVALFLTWIIS